MAPALTGAIFLRARAPQPQLARQIATTRAELSNAGFVSAKEDLAIASSFYAQLPGNWRFRTRIANLSSLNFLGLSPLHNFAQGKGNPPAH
ncbi:hypothetical protein LL965_17345 [Xanthomonas cassavae CFBP 4642]|uniref:CagE TrbE VirB component of type IV transporter system central domain-containing protein n=1 Tax=Xanthomonas cassavae CFBP 4642 TaxID=1219375 RepID=A0ABS8HHT3_9XANT|nr:hypothetical protein [Xanthomonas cassavae]MCC4621749.1 hypothetical protein [Xanthomonas cassavae CFBP 4642]